MTYEDNKLVSYLAPKKAVQQGEIPENDLQRKKPVNRQHKRILCERLVR